MSAGTIALAAILVSGAEGLALIGAGTWLVWQQRILLAASPKPQPPKPAPKDENVPYLDGPPFAGGSGGAS